MDEHRNIQGYPTKPIITDGINMILLFHFGIEDMRICDTFVYKKYTLPFQECSADPPCELPELATLLRCLLLEVRLPLAVDADKQLFTVLK